MREYTEEEQKLFECRMVHDNCVAQFARVAKGDTEVVELWQLENLVTFAQEQSF